jgi:CRISPR/Cas system CMR subunit Cmr4 (Cas7 group RAMP superfamily)
MVVGAVFNLKAPLKVLKSESLEVSLAPLLNTKDENTALLSACNIQERKQQRNQFRDLGNNTNKLVQEDSFSSKIKIVRTRAEETDSRRFSEHRKAENSTCTRLHRLMETGTNE